MLTEVKIFFNNIKHFRHLITEGVSDKTIVDAINNHKYLYVYYDGDSSNEKGWRTIRPFRLGTLQSQTENNGQLALRAWQDKGRSDAFSFPRIGSGAAHDRHTDTDGKVKPGWRLFLVNNITNAYPTGKKFEDENGNVLIPPKYKETDEQIPTAVAMVTATPPQSLKTTGLGSVVEPDVLTRDATRKSRKVTKADIQNLYDIARRVYKKSPNDFVVVTNDRGEFILHDAKTVHKLKPEQIVGDLTALYGKYVKPPRTIDPEVDRFIEKGKKDTLQRLNVSEKENMKKFPIERKTFFK
jgi:hypothetical protein